MQPAGPVQPRNGGGGEGGRVAQVQPPVRRRAYPAGRVYSPRLSFLQLSDHQCRRRLCLSRETVTSLCEILAMGVASNCVGGHPMPVALKVTVVLNFYASGSFQASSADMCGVSQASAHHCIKVVTEANHANHFINFKMDFASQAETARSFSTIAGFPMVQGVIDCMHVAIRAPAGQSGAFISFHSMNVQLVCDHCKGILRVCPCYPASSHNAFILWKSQVPAPFSPPAHLQGWILGDRGYPLKTWLMTPVRIPRNDAEERYNVSQATTRVTIEQTTGLLKMRFRCLNHSGGALQYLPSRVSRIIVVCCALHNLAMERGDSLADDQGQHVSSSDKDGDTDGEEGPQPPDQQGDGAEGQVELSARETREGGDSNTQAFLLNRVSGTPSDTLGVCSADVTGRGDKELQDASGVI
ncbi:putative nuclease HARBI1 [Heterodontus francisci]|uniref:putative nuclease HARBI1 n=1 Tax=Heterodontus francisci TaxID=7792 RepID=UPI00355C7D3E